LTGWQKLGCALYFVVGTTLCYFALIMVAFDGWDEPPMPRWLSLTLFPGLPLLVIACGWLLMKFFTRDKD
jgi:uncharacterized membrane protein YhdT